jgi:hypothetical protein
VLPPPRRGDGFGYCVESPRLSKVVRVASFNYSLRIEGFYTQELRGNPYRYGAERGIRGQESIQSCLLARCFLYPLRFLNTQVVMQR